MRRLHAFALFVVTLFVVVSGTRRASAHPAPHSVVLLDLREHDVTIEMRLPVAELEAALGGPPSDDGARTLVQNDLHVASSDGAAWTIATHEVKRATDEQGATVVVTATLTPPAKASARRFRITNDVIGRIVVSHVAWIGVRSDLTKGSAREPELVGTTRYLRHEVLVDREATAASSAAPGFMAAARLGARHIADGTDHLLFLFALLLPAPLLVARRRWGSAATTRASITQVLRLVTAFTLGHSLTLALAALGWVRLPSAPVELLVAISIVVSAAHAIRPIFPGREALVAGSFGLVHGLAFASALTELHLDGGHLALTLLGFNVGIELMQLAVIAATFPWLVLLARRPAFTAVRVAGALVAGAAAAWWVIDRARAVNAAPALAVLVTFAALVVLGGAYTSGSAASSSATALRTGFRSIFGESARSSNSSTRSSRPHGARGNTGNKI